MSSRDCSEKVRSGVAAAVSVMRYAPPIQCRYDDSSATYSDMLPRLRDSSAEKPACAPIMQPASTKAPSSGPVKEDMSSWRVGGAHVKGAAHTPQVWCRASLV